MNAKIFGTRGARRVVALAVLAAAALLTAACSAPSSSGSGTASTTESAAYRADIAFAQCMRTHGVPNFPAPGQTKVSPVNVNSPQYLAAAGACQHLLPPGAKVSISTSTHQSAS